MVGDRSDRAEQRQREVEVVLGETGELGDLLEGVPSRAGLERALDALEDVARPGEAEDVDLVADDRQREAATLDQAVDVVGGAGAGEAQGPAGLPADEQAEQYVQPVPTKTRKSTKPGKVQNPKPGGQPSLDPAPADSASPPADPSAAPVPPRKCGARGNPGLSPAS